MTITMPETRPEVVLGRRVADLRRSRGLSQTDLAHAMNRVAGVGWDQAVVSRTERAARSVRVDEAFVLAKLLNVTFEDLLRDVRQPLDERVRDLAERKAELRREADAARENLARIVAQIAAVDTEINAIEREQG